MPVGPFAIAELRALALALAAATIACAGSAGAQDYPSRPVRFIVGFAPGGTADFTARLIADRMQGTLGQVVIVESAPINSDPYLGTVQKS